MKGHDNMKEILPRDIKENPIRLISEGWGLLTAGTADAWNTMTVSWGALGELWGKDVAIVFVRPQRHTKAFMDGSEYFTLSFYDETYRDALRLCGTKSGRDVDKAAATGLTPVYAEGTTYFAQAKLVLICKKIACQTMDPAGFLTQDIRQNYNADDYHTTYVGEIVKVLEKE